jgi:hypothetical protein
LSFTVLCLCLAHHSYEVWFCVLFSFFACMCFLVGLYLFMSYVVDFYLFLLEFLGNLLLSWLCWHVIEPEKNYMKGGSRSQNMIKCIQYVQWVWLTVQYCMRLLNVAYSEPVNHCVYFTWWLTATSGLNM